jgi:hypothetical protein
MAQNSSSRLSYNRFTVLFFCAFFFPHAAAAAARAQLRASSASCRCTRPCSVSEFAAAFLIRGVLQHLRARYDITTSQMLVTAFDFSNEDRRSNLQVRYS